LKLVAGLGNPGLEYAWTRHNFGWLVADQVISRLNMKGPQNRFHGQVWGPARLGSDSLCVLKPMTYMNLSGKSVLAAVREYNLVASDCLLVVDDVALPFGALRLRASGSAGGHNGIASVIGAIQTLEIPRLRGGVGRPIDTRGLADFVTDDFDSEERKLLDPFIERATEAVLLWLRLGIDRAMNRVNAG